MIFEQNFRVGIQDVGKDNEITNKAILEMLTNITNYHGYSIGQGTGHLSENPLAWVVLNWKLEVYSRPKVCEAVLIKTWARDYSRVHADRDFEMWTEGGELALKATSRWAALNLKTGRMERLTEEIMAPYGPEPDRRNFNDFRFRKMNDKKTDVLGRAEVKANKSMIDINDHVRNPVYFDIAREVIPDGNDEIHFNDVEVAYKTGIRQYETVTVEYSEPEDNKYLVQIKDDEGHLYAGIVVGDSY
ncbi:MAG: thioesterase [Eubacteriaceae bacterium]|nr:thioesterase [Eubacteriaceae bacterium]